MKILFIALHLLGQKIAKGAPQSNSFTLENGNEKNIDVVNFVSVDSEVGSFRDSLKDIPSLALLANEPQAALPESFTICSDIMTVFSTIENRLMFFNLLDSNEDQLLSAVMIGRVFFTNRIAKGQIPTVFPNQWVRSCMAIDAVSGMINWVVEGTLVENNTIDVLKDSKMPTNLKGKIILGAFQTQTKSWRVYSNKLTNLNIFYGLLPLPDMQKRTKGEKGCFEEGDYLSWSETKWDLQGMATTEVVRQKELKTKPLLNLYPAHFSKEGCKYFCKKLGTQMPPVSNIQAFCGEKKKEISKSVWLTIDDIDKEGVWKDSLTGQSLNNTLPWMLNEPNGKSTENCAGFFDCRWFDISCSRTLHCLCDSEPRPNLRLLGLCNETLIARDYQPQNDVKDIETLTLVSHSTSIQYDQNQMLWLMSVAHHNVSGTSVASPVSFTLGKNAWTIFGDKGCNKKSNSYEIDLKMSGCKDGNFTCYDGQCISMTKRCDQVPNCRDESDEKGCKILVLKESYNKRVPPVGKSAEDELTPAPVKVSHT